MDKPLPLSGSLGEWDLAAILFGMHDQEANGLVKIHTGGHWHGILVAEQKVVCAVSSDPGVNLPGYLLRRGALDAEALRSIQENVRTHDVSEERAIMETGVFDADGLWEEIRRFSCELIPPLFALCEGHFDIVPLDFVPAQATIALDQPIPLFVLTMVRMITDERFIYGRFQNREELFPANMAAAAAYPFKPYETRLLNLVRGNSALGEILKKSPLPPLPTLKILYFFISAGILSYKSQAPAPARTATEKHWIPTFNSFEEALSYFNNRFEYIYRMLSKEIGPVADSILLDAIKGVVERLPIYLRSIQIVESGRLDEKPILKALWYLNFEQTITEVLTGLEEVLYAEIYAVKKHLGKDYEQLILQWMRETGGN